MFTTWRPLQPGSTYLFNIVYGAMSGRLNSKYDDCINIDGTLSTALTVHVSEFDQIAVRLSLHRSHTSYSKVH